MNLNLHLIRLEEAFTKPAYLDSAAMKALECPHEDICCLAKLAELVDWEHSCDTPRTVIGLKSEKQLERKLANPKTRRQARLHLWELSPVIRSICERYTDESDEPQATRLVA